jgi:hypothetical protein
VALFLAFLALLALSTLGACSSAPASETSVVVGVQGDEVLGFVQTVHVVAQVAGQTALETTFPASELPKELRLASSDPSAAVHVVVAGLASAGGQPLVTRTASTRFVAGQTRLLRLRLEARCLASLADGSPGGPVCDAPQTCILGRCVDDAVDPGALEGYAATWPVDGPDFCKPAGHGPPAVVAGTGQTDFLPLVEGQTVTLEKGPQGGHHVWIALRMRNLKQSGSVTVVSGVQPGSGLTVPPTGVVFTFAPDEGGWCKLYGITFRLDDPSDLAFYRNFLGKPLDLTITVKDPAGVTASASAHVQVASKILCPAGDTDPVCAP